MVEAMNGICVFEELDTNDTLSAIQTLAGRYVGGLSHNKRGDGFERFLAWAVVDIQAAAQAPEPGDSPIVLGKLRLNGEMSLSATGTATPV